MDMRKVQKQIEKYELGVHNLFLIRNKNEVRVLAEMARILQGLPDYDPQDLDLEDIYALALNKLPSRYVQHGSIVLGEPVRENDVADAVRYAISVVRDNPSYNKR
jgi:hypothetical protein